MTKSKVRRIKQVRANKNGIIIVQQIKVKTLLRMGRDCQVMVICRRLSEITRDNFEKLSCNQKYTFVIRMHKLVILRSIKLTEMILVGFVMLAGLVQEINTNWATNIQGFMPP